MSQENAKLIEALYAAFGRGDIPTVLAAFDPNIEWTEAENFIYADGNPYIGPEAVLQGVKDDPVAIRARMDALVEQREATQPVRTRTGGSTFKNPDGHKAWQLIDQAGCRGLMRGAAQVSEKHCNFLINTGNATAADIEGLGEDVRARVKAKSGIALEWEIKRVGRAP